MMTSLTIYRRMLAGIAVLLCAPLTASALDQRAEVGQFNASGSLTIDVTRLQSKFPDGMPVAELKVEISNGFYYLTRKGLANDSCRKEAVQLLTSTGLPLVAGSTLAGQRAWLFEATPINLVGCHDDGCHALKNVVPIGSPPMQAARCDVTDLSDNKCKCHLHDGSGWRVTNGDFCNSWMETLSGPLVHWVKFNFITRN